MTGYPFPFYPNLYRLHLPLHDIIYRRTGLPVTGIQMVGGGSINETYRVGREGASVFCKINSATKFPQLLTREKEGLQLLGQSGAFTVPQVYDAWEDSGVQVLLMEWIDQSTPAPSFFIQRRLQPLVERCAGAGLLPTVRTLARFS